MGELWVMEDTIVIKSSQTEIKRGKMEIYQSTSRNDWMYMAAQKRTELKEPGIKHACS